MNLTEKLKTKSKTKSKKQSMYIPDFIKKELQKIAELESKTLGYKVSVNKILNIILVDFIDNHDNLSKSKFKFKV